LVPDRGTKPSYSFKKKFFIVGVILLVLLIVGFNIYRVKNIDVVKVSVSRVSEQHLVEKVPASGNVVAADRKIIFSEVSGTVKDIHVQMGEKVTAGQVLMDLDIPNADQKLAEARANLAAAESNLSRVLSSGQTADVAAAQYGFIQAEITFKKDEDTLERTKVLFEQGGVAQVDLDKAQADFNSSKAAYDKAQAELQRNQDAAPIYLQSLQATVESARLQLDLVEKQYAGQGLLCPQDGQVLSITVQPGDQINVNSPLLTIGNLETLNIQADVPESEAGKIKAGQAVVISGNAFQEEKYQGKVTQVGMEVVNKTRKNQENGTFLPIIVGVEEAPLLLPGYNVDLEITTSDIQALVVPIEALIEKNEGESVYIIKDGLARLTTVKTGISDGITMEIKDGVNNDDQVVLDPPAELHDGSKVRVQ
jgi:RND family efflux transporter, MFP subunit